MLKPNVASRAPHASVAPASAAVLAGLALRLGRLRVPQDFPGLGDTLTAEVAGAFVEDPLVARVAARQQPELHRAGVVCLLPHTSSVHDG
jgi:hypothetical protein